MCVLSFFNFIFKVGQGESKQADIILKYFNPRVKSRRKHLVHFCVGVGPPYPKEKKFAGVHILCLP